MNDPHVEYLRYVVTHGDSIKYKLDELFSAETDEYIVKIVDGAARLHPRRHYATAEEAKLAARDFVGQWNFWIAIGVRDDLFKLKYADARVIARPPSPTPPGVFAVNADPVDWGVTPAVSVGTTLVRYAYLGLPPRRRLAVDDPGRCRHDEASDELQP